MDTDANSKQYMNTGDPQKDPTKNKDDAFRVVTTNTIPVSPELAVPPIIAIDRQSLQADSPAQKEKNDYLDLLESYKVEKMMSGIVSGVEEHGGMTVAVVYHGCYKIIIPASHFMQITEEIDLETLRYKERIYLSTRLGSEVDFIITKISNSAQLAAGNRLRAMRIRQWNYFQKRNGVFMINSGSLVEARVVSTRRTGIFAEVFGKELFIPAKELTYKRISDATQIFYPGQRVIVKIIRLERDIGKRQITAFDISVKQAQENPIKAGMKKYSVNSKYYGEVTMVDKNGVFVSLDDQVECLCAYPKFGHRPIRGAKVTVRITMFDEQRCRIFGVISYMQPQY